jgi:hypothetical protein
MDANSLSHWLKQFTMTTVGRLQDLNVGVIARVLPSRPSRRYDSRSSIRAAMLVRPSGVLRLRLANNAVTRQRFGRIEKALARAA